MRPCCWPNVAVGVEGVPRAAMLPESILGKLFSTPWAISYFNIRLPPIMNNQAIILLPIVKIHQAVGAIPYPSMNITMQFRKILHFLTTILFFHGKLLFENYRFITRPFTGGLYISPVIGSIEPRCLPLQSYTSISLWV